MSGAAGAGADVLERDAELARIEAAVARAQGGHGSLLVVEGPAGIGKSALIGAARALSDAAGARTLRARGGELERDFAFGVVRQLLEPALAEAPARARDDLLQGPAGVAGRLLGLPGARPEGGEVAAPDASFTVLHGLYWLCANLAGDRPLVLTVDDAHWADAPSLRFLAFLLPRLEELSLALVVATRPEAEGAAAPLLALLLADPLARVLRPAPLSAGAVGRLIEEGLGRAPDPDFAAACQRTTGGVPFLVRELVEALREEGVAPTAAEAPRVEALGARTVGPGDARAPEPPARRSPCASPRRWRCWRPPSSRRPPTSPASTPTRRPRRPTSWSPRASSARGARWPSRTRSCARGSSRRCRRPSACAPTGARPSCSPCARTAASAWPSTCWRPSRPATRGRWRG